MSTITADLRATLRDRFRDAFGDRLDLLILYGSYARGEATSRSDIDLLVVLEGEVGAAEKERAYTVKEDLLDETGVVVSPLVTSRERFDTYDQPLFRNVRAEGELLVPADAPTTADPLRGHTYPSNRSRRGMKQSTEDALDRARDTLDTARLLRDNEKVSAAVSSAYYAMLYAARAALNEADRAPKSHRGVQHQLREAHVEDGPLDARYHSLLSAAEEKRLEADYEMSPAFTADDAERWIARAQEFLGAIEGLLLDDT
jgi:uncharacterized protein (UPF0332 family)/predicted nucleotidyltransferase